MRGARGLQCGHDGSRFLAGTHGGRHGRQPGAGKGDCGGAWVGRGAAGAGFARQGGARSCGSGDPRWRNRGGDLSHGHDRRAAGAAVGARRPGPVRESGYSSEQCRHQCALPGGRVHAGRLEPGDRDQPDERVPVVPVVCAADERPRIRAHSQPGFDHEPCFATRAGSLFRQQSGPVGIYASAGAGACHGGNHGGCHQPGAVRHRDEHAAAGGRGPECPIRFTNSSWPLGGSAGSGSARLVSMLAGRRVYHWNRHSDRWRMDRAIAGGSITYTV